MTTQEVPRSTNDRVLNEAAAMRQAADDGELQELLKVTRTPIPVDPLTKPDVGLKPLRNALHRNTVDVVVEGKRLWAHKSRSGRKEDHFWFQSDADVDFAWDCDDSDWPAPAQSADSTQNEHRCVS